MADTTWVDCPICGESDMCRTAEENPTNPGQGYIACVNLNCGSNGGDNFAALVRKEEAEPVLVYYEDRPMITYCHPSDPSVRFRQYASDKTPKWASDIKPA